MITQTIKDALTAIGAGVLLYFGQSWLGGVFLIDFLARNLITLLVALLAINSATMGIVSSKIRDMMDSSPRAGGCFQRTKRGMLHSIREQISLIVIAIILLVSSGSPKLASIPNLAEFADICLVSIFVYAMRILYDTAKSVLIILDFDPSKD